MKKIGILLPGKIGDVIICLPIAKQLHDNGYEVHWCLWPEILPHFIKGHFNYVNFTLVDKTQMCGDVSIDYYNSIGCDEILDLSFNNIGSWQNDNSIAYRNQHVSFDEFRYNLAGVNFDNKWNFTIKRDIDTELELYDTIIKQQDYAVTNFKGSDAERIVKLNNKKNLQIVDVEPVTDCIFDWITILERSKYIICIDSAIANMVNQMNMTNSKNYFLKRSIPRDTPVLRGKWYVI